MIKTDEIDGSPESVGAKLALENLTNPELGVAHLVDLEGGIVFKCIFLIFT